MKMTCGKVLNRQTYIDLCKLLKFNELIMAKLLKLLIEEENLKSAF